MADLKSAIISPCRLYRYDLGRRWGIGKTCTFIMLNPSTADADIDDPTIRRCLGFARREDCRALRVVNLFAYRANDPADLIYGGDNPIGPDNLSYLYDAIIEADGPLIAAWGAWRGAQDPGGLLARLFPGLLQCLGQTKSGAPRHPLYVRADAPLIPWRP